MTVKVKFFASLIERLGLQEVELDVGEGMTVAAVWDAVTDCAPLREKTMMAVNLDYCTAEQMVADGDEIAFFPPITGG